MSEQAFESLKTDGTLSSFLAAIETLKKNFNFTDAPITMADNLFVASVSVIADENGKVQIIVSDIHESDEEIYEYVPGQTEQIVR